MNSNHKAFYPVVTATGRLVTVDKGRLTLAMRPGHPVKIGVNLRPYVVGQGFSELQGADRMGVDVAATVLGHIPRKWLMTCPNTYFMCGVVRVGETYQWGVHLRGSGVRFWTCSAVLADPTPVIHSIADDLGMPRPQVFDKPEQTYINTPGLLPEEGSKQQGAHTHKYVFVKAEEC